MNIIQKIKVLLLIQKLINHIKEGLKKMEGNNNGVKPGWRCTEFWLTVITNLITIVGALKGIIKPETMVIVLAILNGIYGILRSLVKAPKITTLVEKQ